MRLCNLQNSKTEKKLRSRDSTLKQDSTESNKSFSTPADTVFTTQRKKPKTSIDICRKGSIVKERCKQLVAYINNMFPSQVVTDEDLTCIIEDYIGGDKETIRSYKGYSGHVRAGRCGDNHIVGLSRKGYLERYGFLRKIPGRRWIVVQSVLFSQASVKGHSGFDSNEKISISSNSFIPKGKGSEGKPILEVCPNSEDGSSREREEEEATEKDRNLYPMICPMIQESLTETELAVLTAKPGVESDKSKVNWGSS